MKRFHAFVMLAAAAVFMAACGDDSFRPQARPQYHAVPAQQPDGSHAAAPAAPAPVQSAQAQPQSEGIQWGSVAAGAVGGYLLGRALEPSAPPPQSVPQSVREVVRETRYVTRTVPAQPAQAAPPTAKPPSAPAFAPPVTPKPEAPKPTVVVPKFAPPPPAPAKYGGPSGYSSVAQSRPSYSSRRSPSRSSSSSGRR